MLADLTLSTAQVEQHQVTQPSLTIQLVVKAYFNVLSQHLPRDAKEIHGTLHKTAQDARLSELVL
jgi:hypothetical protein